MKMWEEIYFWEIVDKSLNVLTFDSVSKSVSPSADPMFVG